MSNLNYKTVIDRQDQEAAEMATQAFLSQQREIRWLTLLEVRAFFGNISAATVYRHVKAGLISPPVKVGPNINRWTEQQCINDREKMISASRGQAA